MFENIETWVQNVSRIIAKLPGTFIYGRHISDKSIHEYSKQAQTYNLQL